MKFIATMALVVMAFISSGAFAEKSDFTKNASPSGVIEKSDAPSVEGSVVCLSCVCPDGSQGLLSNCTYGKCVCSDSAVKAPAGISVPDKLAK